MVIILHLTVQRWLNTLAYDGVDDLKEGCVIKPLANAARMDGTHGIVRATLLVALGSMLHGKTARNTISTREEFGGISATAARAENPSE